MSLSYLDDGGLGAVWAKVKSFFKKNSAVYITLTTSGNMPTVETQGVTWTITSQVDNNGDTLTNSELYDTVLNGADVYIYLASSDYPLGANVKWGHASVEKVFSSIGEETEIYIHSHTQFFDYRSMGGASYDIVPVVFYGRITRNAGLMNYTSGVLSYMSRADDVKYNNSYSGISSDNVQDAIDEIANNYLPIDPQGSDNPLVSNLELEKNGNPRYYTKSTSIDCTEADNGISSGAYYAGLFNVDTNDTIIGTFETLASSNGAVSSRLTARNSGTGTQVSNILTIGVYNNGSPFVSITNNDATREAWQIALGLAFAPGNSCNLAGMTCPGHLTSSKGSVVFYIPLAKSIASTVSNVSVSSTNCEIRHSDGGYIGSGDLSSRGTISSSIAAGRQGVTVTLSLSQASTFTNNAPITIRFYGTSTLTFS